MHKKQYVIFLGPHSTPSQDTESWSPGTSYASASRQGHFQQRKASCWHQPAKVREGLSGEGGGERAQKGASEALLPPFHAGS